MSDYEPGATRVGGATSTGPAVRTDMAEAMPRPVDSRPLERRPERVTTETKSSFKTTELIFYVLSVAGVLIASKTIGTDNSLTRGVNHIDYFRADRAWLYITLLTIGYMISRGLAKSGSREPYDR